MLEHTPKSCLNEAPVKSTGLQRESSLVRSSYSSGLISSTVLWLSPLRALTELDGCKHVEWHVKKRTWGRKLCGMILSLGLLCWFVFPSDRHTLLHNTRTHSLPQQGALISLHCVVQEVYLCAAAGKHFECKMQTKSNRGLQHRREPYFSKKEASNLLYL